jgi:predicted GNAT superfamily acetyltransferase
MARNYRRHKAYNAEGRQHTPEDIQKVKWEMNNQKSVHKAQTRQAELVAKGYKLINYGQGWLEYHYIKAFNEGGEE